nr:FAD-dependent oxidoreductase [Oceanococcus sp. HetDA_MAG_MS8]
MKVAIIGSGISGLAAAWGLNKHHETTLFEAESRLGGHTATMDVQLHGRDYRVDTGFIVYNDRTYPNLIRLFDALDIQGRATSMSFSVATADGSREYCSEGLGGIFATRSDLLRPSQYRLLRDILRFNKDALALQGCTQDTRTLAEFVEQGGYSQDLADRYVYPLCAAIWSTSLETARQFPAEHFARFFANHGLLSLKDRPQWRTVPGGSRTYIERMVPRLDCDIRTSTPVRGVERDAKGVTLFLETGPARFDAVVLACHSDQALALLNDASENERQILGAIPYVDNDVVLHTDRRFMPQRKRAWASWNYKLHPDPDHPATLTYGMNRLQGLDAPEPFCVTLNDNANIDPSKVLGQYVYAHPVYTPQSNAARARRDEINGHNNTWFTGAYWYNGFHEDGARSALEVSQALGGGW